MTNEQIAEHNYRSAFSDRERLQRLIDTPFPGWAMSPHLPDLSEAYPVAVGGPLTVVTPAPSHWPVTLALAALWLYLGGMCWYA